jgi:hypothetical protein
MALTSMIDHDIYLVENKGYWMMGINYHWISRMVYLISDVRNLLRSFLPYLTSSRPLMWDPSKYDKDIDDIEKFHYPGEDDHEEYHFDQYGEYHHRTVANHHTYLEEEFFDACEFLDFDDQVDDLLDSVHPNAGSDIYGMHSSEVSKVTPNYCYFDRYLDGHLKIP